jgi:hypothetical protein
MPARARNHREPSIASAKGCLPAGTNAAAHSYGPKRPTTSCPIRAVNQLQTQDTRTAARRGCGCDGRTQLGSWPDRIRRRRAPGAQCGRRLRRRSDSTDNCRVAGWSDGTRASAAGYCRFSVWRDRCRGGYALGFSRRWSPDRLRRWSPDTAPATPAAPAVGFGFGWHTPGLRPLTRRSRDMSPVQKDGAHVLAPPHSPAAISYRHSPLLRWVGAQSLVVWCRCPDS